MTSRSTPSSPASPASPQIREIESSFPDLVAVLFGSSSSTATSSASSSSSSSSSVTFDSLKAMGKEERDKLIMRAYRRRSLYVHPDRAGTAGTEAFRHLKRASEILTDEKLSSVYFSASGTAQQKYDAVSGKERDIQMGFGDAPVWLTFLIFPFVAVFFFFTFLTSKLLGKFQLDHCNERFGVFASLLFGFKRNEKSNHNKQNHHDHHHEEEDEDDHHHHHHHHNNDDDKTPPMMMIKVLASFLFLLVLLLVSANFSLKYVPGLRSELLFSTQELGDCTLYKLVRRSFECETVFGPIQKKYNKGGILEGRLSLAGRKNKKKKKNTHKKNNSSSSSSSSSSLSWSQLVEESYKKRCSTSSSSSSLTKLPSLDEYTNIKCGMKYKTVSPPFSTSPSASGSSSSRCTKNIARLAYSSWRNNKIVKEAEKMRRRRSF